MTTGPSPASIPRLLKDPLLHFAALGLALFVGFMLLNDPQTSAQTITVSTAQQEQLVAAYTRVWRRPPNTQEFKGLLDDWVREEIANREAIAMGLGANDLVVRQRLRQKYESFMEQMAASLEPGDAELRAWYLTRASDYRADARYTLRQRFFSNDRRDDARGDAKMALQGINKDNAEIDTELGDPLAAIPERFENNRETEIGNRLGTAFAQSLEGLPQGRWSGPIPSAYGFHLVYLESAQASTQPDLDLVKNAVLRDWRAQQISEATERLYAGLLKRYDIDIQTPPAKS